MSKQLLHVKARRARGAVRSTLCCRRALVWFLLCVLLFRGVCLPSSTAASGMGEALLGALQIPQTYKVYGPRRFERATGAPVTVNDNFVPPADAVAPFTVQ